MTSRWIRIRNCWAGCLRTFIRAMSGHDTGTYYTPREIVHFMCREVLDGYLRDEVPGLPAAALDALRRRAGGMAEEADNASPRWMGSSRTAWWTRWRRSGFATRRWVPGLSCWE